MIAVVKLVLIFLLIFVWIAAICTTSLKITDRADKHNKLILMLMVFTATSVETVAFWIIYRLILLA